MKKVFALPALALILALLGASPAPAVEASQSPSMKPLAVGQPFPDIGMAAPLTAREAKELGIKPKAKSVTVADFKAQGVILVIYSMYCPFCQREAPQLNVMHKLIRERGLADRLKLVGLGAGNSPFEVNVFREKYGLTFPLLPDKDFSAYNSLGKVGTPFYYVLKRQGRGFTIVQTQLGCVTSPEAFLDDVIAKTGVGKEK